MQILCVISHTCTWIHFLALQRPNKAHQPTVCPQPLLSVNPDSMYKSWLCLKLGSLEADTEAACICEKWVEAELGEGQ